jgi:SAM-dependent methyltransferase
MSVFGNYARYYDLLYKDKDYQGEANYVRNLIEKYAQSAGSILELGCGTGAHAKLLAEFGYRLHGVDLSEDMLTVAHQRKLDSDLELAERMSFSKGDIRNVKVDGHFDVVLSLFHVMSYLVTNEDLQAAIATAKSHLKPGGIFIFDCWYGPAVLTDRPAVRVKELEDNEIAVTRIAEPVIYANENLVDVNYHIFIRDKSDQSVQELKETHRMRYLFKTELEFLLQAAGMAIIEQSEWMTGRELGFDTWGACFVVRG